MKRPLIAVLFVLGTIAAPAVAAHGDQQHEDHANAGWPVDKFTLTDQRGTTFDQQRLQGRWTFVVFGDTRCAAPCSAAMDALAAMFRRIAGTEAVKTTQVIFISLDPQRDTPAALGKYLAPFDARFVGATGAVPALKQLAEDLRALDETAPPPRTAATKYRGSLLLIGPDGVVRTEYVPPFDVRRLTAAFLKTRARR